MKPNFMSAIKVLVPNAQFVASETKIMEWHSKEPQPSQKEIDAKLAELHADYDAKQYQRDRLQEYPSIQELVVALYDEEDKASIIEKRNAVKAKYPKPE